MTAIDVCCGLGGSGKTTTAALIGLAHAAAGRRAVVLTIDPARRLANALHIPLEGAEPTEVPLDGLGLPGTLSALMLDRTGTFDAVVRRFSPDADTAERLLANRYYRAVSTRLTGAHEYMAMRSSPSSSRPAGGTSSSSTRRPPSTSSTSSTRPTGCSRSSTGRCSGRSATRRAAACSAWPPGGRSA